MKTHPFLFGLLAGLLAACATTDKPKTTATPPAETRPDTLPALKLSKTPVEKTVSLPGELLPDDRVQVYAKIPGYVRRINVDIGSMVHRGQVLAVLDAPEQQARLTEVRSQLQAATARLTASRDIYVRLRRAAQTPGIVAESELERVRNQYLSDSAGVQAIRASAGAARDIAAYLTLRAPFDGVVTKRQADVGSYVGGSANVPVLELENNRTLRLRVAVPEVLTGGELTSKQIFFTTKAAPNQKREAVLVRKSDAIDATTRSELWEFVVQNPDHKLKSGMFTDVTLPLSRSKPSFLVPFSAVVTTLEKKFVIRVSGGQAAWVDVRTGLNVPDKVEIFGELREGDTLLLKPNEEIKPDTKVVAQFEPPKPN